jgi:hypothetical protein
MAWEGAAAYGGLGLGDLFYSIGGRDAPYGGNSKRRRRGRDRWGGFGSQENEQHARAVVETVAEKATGLDQPKTQMVATDAEWELRRQGVWADRFIEGNMHLAQGMFRDTWDLARHGFLLSACSTGTVAARVEPDYVSKRVRTQLRSTLNTFIDPGDVANGQPLSYFDVTWENPEYMLEDERFKAHKDLIWKSSEVPPQHLKDYDGGATYGTRMVKWTSAWRMPFGKFKGRQAIFVGGEWVLWEDWKFPEPPLAFFRWNRCVDPSNFWGENFIRIMLAPLRDASDIDDIVQNTMSKTSQTNISLDGTSTGPKAVLDAHDVNVYRYDSKLNQKPPIVDKPGLLHADYFQYRDRKIQIAKELAGVPDMHITSQSSAPSSSGRSKRLEASLLPERIAKKLRGWRDWTAVDIATRQIRAAREIGAVEPNWQVTWPGADFDSKVSVKVLDIDDEIYTILSYAVSEQKNTPSARADDAQEMLERGEISKEQLAVILGGLYDTPKEGKVASAQRRKVAKTLDDMLHADEDVIADENVYWAERYTPPAPWDNAAAALAQAQPVYDNAIVDGVPQNRRNLMRRYMEELVALKSNQDREAAMAAASVNVTATPEQAFPTPQPQPGGGIGQPDMGGAPLPAPGAPPDMGLGGAMPAQNVGGFPGMA